MESSGKLYQERSTSLDQAQLGGSIKSLITYISLIRVVIDYLLQALNQDGTIEIANTPLQGYGFAEFLRRNLVMELVEEYRGRFPRVTFTVFDLRKTVLN